MTTDRVEILSVSTKINEIDYSPQGSIVGGTNVYIRAKGHNIMPSKNSINIGPYPCIIEENGISGDLITCKTTHAFDANQRWGLPVELHVAEKVESKCRAAAGCKFTFRESSTPYLKFISPSVSSPDGTVNWHGIWRVSDTSAIKKLVIGGFNCNRFLLEDTENPKNLNDGDEINA
jgi:hypothetical protein